MRSASSFLPVFSFYMGRSALPFCGDSQKHPDSKMYVNIQPILSRPINWDIIRKYYDEIIKYTTALKQGTADAESILSRFTRNKNGVKHPAFQAILELGKVRKTIFLCEYLNSEALRQEIEEGLNVIENWNGVNNFIWYGKGGEIAVNNKEDQELAILSLHLLQICGYSCSTHRKSKVEFFKPTLLWLLSVTALRFSVQRR